MRRGERRGTTGRERGGGGGGEGGGGGGVFFFNDTATTEIYTLSLHDALPIFQFPCAHLTVRDFHSRLGCERSYVLCDGVDRIDAVVEEERLPPADRKSTRLNSSHALISYAVFCLKKKKITKF